MKVETYHAQLPQETQIPDTLTRTHDRSKNFKAETKIGDLWKVFSAGGSYGMDQKRGTEQAYRTSLVTKLLVIVEELGKQGKIGLIDDVLKARGTRGYDFLYVRERMRVASYDQEKVKIETSANGLQLELTCSVRNFSEYASDGTVFKLHSGNYDFFEGRVSPSLTSLIVPLDWFDNRLIATPLFLALDTVAGIKL